VDARVSTAFRALLDYVRLRAPGVLNAPTVGDHHPGVEALVNLSRFASAHVRTTADWPGTSASFPGPVCALARHLVCDYRVPAFLAASWYAIDDAYAEKKREWFVAHTRGASFRSLDHRRLGVGTGGLTWAPSLLRPMLVEQPSQDPSEPPVMWHIMELKNGARLRTEGSALDHCVASYADRCWRGASRIWSLRLQQGESVRHVLTIEVVMTRRTVVQARGRGNRAAFGKPLRLVQEWAVRERLRLTI
jgi:hypothetical protein